MYTVKVRNSIMIAHSLPNPFFGPAQHMHGATYVVDVTFSSEKLDPHNVVIDIGKAKDITSDVLSHLNYKNLDELPQFKNKLTTTEFMAKYIYDKIKVQVATFFEGKISVCLGETHDAWASYSGN
jgi:6-pyruvoyltetrahydropterin/6-carboxytetrahydropterin synthase